MILHQQLAAIREQAKVLVAMIDAALAEPDPAACEHPARDRLTVRAMGQSEAWICRACGARGPEAGSGTEARAAPKEG